MISGGGLDRYPWKKDNPSMAKIKRYNGSGEFIEIEDTPRKREWAKGKGYPMDQSPVEETSKPWDEHVGYPELEPFEDRLGDEE